jgi:ribosomal protein L17
MRHKKNSLLQFESGVQKQSLLMRNMLTSLVTYGQITTTPKRAKVLKSEANKLFNRLVRTAQASEQDGVRRCISYVKSVLFTDEAGKKLITELLPRFLEA